MSSSQNASHDAISRTRILVSCHIRSIFDKLTVPATAVSRIDNLEFLSDVVPKTQTYRQYKAEKAQEEATKAAAGVNGDRPGSSSRNIQDMMQQPQTANGETLVNGHSHAHSPITDRTVRHTHPDPIRDLDVNMSG
jgi:hypothetical protein